MTDHLAELRTAGAAYQEAREQADRIMATPRETLTAKVRAAYAAGLRKIDILRAINHVWSRQWIDDTVRDIEPPGGRPTKKAKPRSQP